MTCDLSVNLNKIALIRNSRLGNYPNLVSHAQTCLDHGANGLTVHPRPDQRHIRPGDVTDLAGLIKKFSSATGLKKEFNIEGNPFAPADHEYPGLYALAQQSKPEQVTLVPDGHNQLTSDHGFNLEAEGEKLKPVVEQYHALNIRVSLFMDPDIEQIRLAKGIGADRIELYTGPYAQAHLNSAPDLNQIIDRYRIAAIAAHDMGLGINAGHDLNLENLPAFLQIPNISEVSIGHALTVDALSMGLGESVRQYAELCQIEHPSQTHKPKQSS